MQAEPHDIDAIVREVLARLAATAPPAPPPSPSPPPASPAAAEVALTDAVVTVEALAAHVTSGTRRLVISPRAVVTPSARDWLRARSVELARATASANASAKPPAIGKFYLHSTRPHSAARSWGRRISDAGWELEILVPCELVQASAELAAVLGPANRLGVLLTNETAAAICLANRHAHVRAAAAASVEDVRAALRQIHANLLVADPARAGEFVQRRMIQEFVRVGPRVAPKEWRGDA